MMPGMSGYALCAACKSDPALRRFPFILLTTLDTPLDVIRALKPAILINATPRDAGRDPRAATAR
jgi:CheY-like chemotaxis protein